MAAEGVEGLVVAEVALGEVVMIEEGMNEVAILLEVAIAEDTGAGQEVMRHTKGYNQLVWPCTGTIRTKTPSRRGFRVCSSGRLSLYSALVR